jgi:AcrR family transcriptional regulator
MAGHREALLEGAIHCIQAKGYARTTARDIVAASGTNLASIGYHYGSKEALLRQAIRELFRRWYMPLIARAAEAGAEASLDTVLAGLDEHRSLLVSHFEALAEVPRNDELRAFIADAYSQFRDALAEQLGGGAEAEESAGLLIAALDGAIVQWFLGLDWRPRAPALLRAVGPS